MRNIVLCRTLNPIPSSQWLGTAWTTSKLSLLIGAWIALAAAVPVADMAEMEFEPMAAYAVRAIPGSETGAGAYMPDMMRLEELPGDDIVALLSDTEKVMLGANGPEVIVMNDDLNEEVHPPLNQRGVFLTPSSIGNPSFRERTIEAVTAANGNMIVFDVKGSGVHFDAQSTPLAHQLGLIDPKYSLKEVVNLLHERGIYAVARYIAVKDHSLVEKLPETNLYYPNTNTMISPGWIDPANPRALEYNRQIICELAEAGVDEINMDYIRYSTQARGVMTAYTGEQRIEKIETFLRMAREAIDACGPDTKLGVSTFAILGWDYQVNAEALGQDVVRFADMLDVISPMAYNENFTTNRYDDPSGKRTRWYWLVNRTLTGYAKELGPDHAWKLRPWLQGWDAGPEEIREQIRGVYDAGICGFQVWNAGNSYSQTYSAMDDVRLPSTCPTGETSIM